MLGLSKSILKRLADFHLVLLLETYLVAFINEEFRQILEEEDKNIRNKHGHDYAIDSNKELIDSLLAYIADTIGSKRNAKLWSEFQALVLYFSHVKTSFEQVTDLLILLFEHKFSTVSLHLPSKVSNPTSFAIKRYFLSQIE